MTTNPYFNKFHRRSEQNLVDDLVREAIQIHGHDFVYLPRKLQKEDLLYGEDVISKFEDYYDVEMYIKSVDGFEGQGDLMSKFGIEIKDQATLWVSRTVFNNAVNSEEVRPKEGDLLYYPLNGAMLEIKFVTNETLHYQLGDLYVYELTCEQFVFSDEKFDTGLEDIDKIEAEQSYSIILGLGAGAGTFLVDEFVYQGASLATATAKAEVSLVGPDGIPANTLQIRNIVGVFNMASGNIIGNTSGASYALATVNDQANVNDDNDDSVRLETEGDAVIDFSEDDPFSEGNY